jgi:hypothetical protein
MEGALLLGSGVLSLPASNDIGRVALSAGGVDPAAADSIPLIEQNLIAFIIVLGLCLQLAMPWHPLYASIAMNLIFLFGSAYLLAVNAQNGSYTARSVWMGIPASMGLTFSRFCRIVVNTLGPPRVARSWLALHAQHRSDSDVMLYRMLGALLTGGLLRRMTLGLPPAQQLAYIFAPEAARIAMILHATAVSSEFKFVNVNTQGLHMAMAGFIAFASGVYFAHSAGVVDEDVMSSDPLIALMGIP